MDRETQGLKTKRVYGPRSDLYLQLLLQLQGRIAEMPERKKDRETLAFTVYGKILQDVHIHHCYSN